MKWKESWILTLILWNTFCSEPDKLQISPVFIIEKYL